MGVGDPFSGNEALKRIVTTLFETPERTEWIPKTDVIALEDLRDWLSSGEIEILGFAHSMIADGRFHIEPPLSRDEYLRTAKHYFERCLHENPDGEWSDSCYTAGYNLVNIFGSLWWDANVPRLVFDDLKAWIGELYKNGDDEIRTCLVQATLEHLVEQNRSESFFRTGETIRCCARPMRKRVCGRMAEGAAR